MARPNTYPEMTDFSGNGGLLGDRSLGLGFMKGPTLLQITAQNTLAGNVVQEFTPNATTTVAGIPYVYNGLVYVAKEVYKGAWDSSKFFSANIEDIIRGANKVVIEGNSSNNYVRKDLYPCGGKRFVFIPFSTSWTLPPDVVYVTFEISLDYADGTVKKVAQSTAPSLNVRPIYVFDVGEDCVRIVIGGRAADGVSFGGTLYDITGSKEFDDIGGFEERFESLGSGYRKVYEKAGLEAGKYVVEIELLEYTFPGADSDFFNVQVNNGGTRKYTNHVAYKNTSSGLNSPMAFEIEIESGDVISFHSALSLYGKVKISKFGSLSYNLFKNGLAKLEALKDKLELGGIRINNYEWVYYNSTSPSGYYNRFRLKEEFALYLKPGDAIRCKDWTNIMAWCGYLQQAGTNDTSNPCKYWDPEGYSGTNHWWSQDIVVREAGWYVFVVTKKDQSNWINDFEMQSYIDLFYLDRAEKTTGEVVANFVNTNKLFPFFGETLGLKKGFYVNYLADEDLTDVTTMPQGMAISGTYLIDLFHTGQARLYNITDNFTIVPLTSLFNLGSQGSSNHANCASFSNEKRTSGNLPLLYVTQYISGSWKCFVEDVNPSGSSSLVQTISLASGLFGYSCDFAVDRITNKLIVWGNTIDSSTASNKHRIMVFDIPNSSSGYVTLTSSDAIENYLMEDYSSEIKTVDGSKKVFSIQGGFTRNGLLYILVSGDGTQAEADRLKILYVWDYQQKRLVAKMPLDGVIDGELEDADYHNGAIVLKSGYGKNKFYKLFEN